MYLKSETFIMNRHFSRTFSKMSNNCVDLVEELKQMWELRLMKVLSFIMSACGMFLIWKKLLDSEKSGDSEEVSKVGFLNPSCKPVI